MTSNLNRGTHVDVVAEIDILVGKRGRSASLTEIAQREIKLLQQREALRQAAGAWNDKDHPELPDEAYAWVRKMRAGSGARSQEVEQHRRRSR